LLNLEVIRMRGLDCGECRSGNVVVLELIVSKWLSVRNKLAERPIKAVFLQHQRLRFGGVGIVSAKPKVITLTRPGRRV
jgi:hypothetical protein